MRRSLSKSFYILRTLFKLAVNTLSIPYTFFVADGEGKKAIIAFLRNSADAVLNFERVRQRAIEKVTLANLPELLSADDLYAHIKFGSGYGNINFIESVALSYLVYASQPKKIFEIGTFDGFSTYHLAMNSDVNAQVYTLNLPITETNSGIDASTSSLSDYSDDSFCHDKLYTRGIGALYKRSPAGVKVRQLLGDSTSFDFSSFHNTINFVFIDGGHSLRCVRSDTENAFKMLTKSGIIVWHDFNVQHRDVYMYLCNLSKTHKLYWIENTRLAFYTRRAHS